MPSVSLKAHYDGKAIRLDEPFELTKGTRLIVTVMEDAQPELDRSDWTELGIRGLARAYGESEPEYSLDDVLP